MVAKFGVAGSSMWMLSKSGSVDSAKNSSVRKESSQKDSSNGKAFPSFTAEDINGTELAAV